MKTGLASVEVAIDPSQLPDKLSDDLRQSLRARQVNHKFHYESHKQAQKWLAVHRSHSPFQKDPAASDVYRQSYRALLSQLSATKVHLIGLGCGSGQKDAELLELLAEKGITTWYSPVDVSLPLVLRAQAAATRIIDSSRCRPIIADLSEAVELPALLAQSIPGDVARIFTFFGMLPNFESAAIFPRLATLLNTNDRLLFSANLAPGSDYRAGLRKILPQYDNLETHDWLLTFLLDLGVEKSDGNLRIQIEDISPLVAGVVARFRFERTRELEVAGETFRFPPGDEIRLFFSCRHTPAMVTQLLEEHGLALEGSWINASGEEGVFRARKN